MIHQPRRSYSMVCYIKTTPEACRPRKLAPDKLKVIKTEFNLLLQEGIIQLRKVLGSCYYTWLLTGRTNGDPAMITESWTIPNQYPIPHIEDFTHFLNRKKMSTLDLVRAYNQISVHPNDIPKTAIITPFGMYEFHYMPFRLRNTQIFQKFTVKLYMAWISVTPILMTF